MNFGIRFKLIAFGLTAGLLGTSIVVITFSSQRQVSVLRAQLNNVDSESSGIFNQFQESLRALNSDMLRYGTGHDPVVWNKGFHAALALDLWIDKQTVVLRSPAEMDLLKKIQPAYDNYLRSLQTFHTRVQSLAGRSASLADFTPVRERSQRLFDLGQALAHAHYLSHNELLQHANRSLKKLHASILILVGLLFLLGMAMAIGVYRNLIAPLHVKLLESRSFAEQHESLASLGLLASGVAQEIRNPLTSVKIGMHFQKNKFQPGSAERAEAEVVEMEIRRLEKIVDDFLTLTQLAAPKPAALQLEEFLKELRHFFVPRLASADIQLVTDIPAPLRVRVDVAQLKQAVINLVQYTANQIGRNGCITLRVRPDSKSLAGHETKVAIFEVVNTGKSILSEDEKNLSKPLFNSETAAGGLGLSIAAQIVRKNGGEMQRQSQADQSIAFGIILPRI
jgi:signal transduction histidine kinase